MCVCEGTCMSKAVLKMKKRQQTATLTSRCGGRQSEKLRCQGSSIFQVNADKSKCHSAGWHTCNREDRNCKLCFQLGEEYSFIFCTGVHVH